MTIPHCARRHLILSAFGVRDALEKYNRWAEINGVPRFQRQAVQAEQAVVNTVNRRADIFVPHRPKLGGGKQFLGSDISQVLSNDLEVEGELINLERGVRNSLKTKAVAELAEPVPLYKLRKRFPLGYGRRRRSAQNTWTLLDPNTGRPIKSAEPDAFLRPERQGNGVINQELEDLQSTKQFQDAQQQFQEYLEFKRKHPYSG
ncbi:uncharacterized protein LOC111696540 isoform X2 [Eurytemora carolleeae]|uniref:uncharacterized protein LOC111696540 isoform X2 n=1 Tax=Eurytemora carolleeae TaxID=1294199 RepID=UPI000C76B1AF|nr:uncharacterized protein LOC111696540 isoform X2 [Eurytemora carolleeae]|eukprot:XP_023322054.1 uncharacterized protein LOC111696540 isoform X2 [Eurytemora affinis]